MPAPMMQTSHCSRDWRSAGSVGVVSCQTETVSNPLRCMHELGAVPAGGGSPIVGNLASQPSYAGTRLRRTTSA